MSFCVKTLGLGMLLACVGAVWSEEAAPAAPAEAKPAEAKAEEAKPAEAGKCAKCGHVCAQCACKDKGCKDGKEKGVAVEIVEPDAAQSDLNARIKARADQALTERIAKLIGNLALPSWREAHAELLKIGKPAVPALIDALEGTAEQTAKLHAYPPVAPGRATRQNHHAAVVYEVLDDLIRNHSSFTGKVPAQNKDEWKEFWSANGESLALGK